MNGDTYSGRCGPDPQAWQSYWQRIVTTMRQVPGAAFRFDFAPSRGEDAVAWPQCYPGDRYVDIIGMDTYDQDPGTTFQDYIDQPYGLKFQVEFAAAHGKPVSYPEWGLFRRGDDPAFIQGMHDWIATHDVVYETVTDYCPHGVWQCGAQNPKSAALYQKLFGPGSTA
nr:glycosyl hydrolase [Pseudonocardia acidicola]